MKVTILGPGRIGVPIGNCVRKSGHDVSILARSASRSGDIARAEGFEVSIDLDDETWEHVDLLIFAAATEDRSKYPDALAVQREFKRLRELTGNLPIASVAGNLDLASLKSLFGDRPIGRFFCSSAVGASDSLRFFDAHSHPEVIDLLTTALPSDKWLGVPSHRFERFGALLVSAALLCGPLCEITRSMGPFTDDEQVFLLDTILETRRLMAVHGNDPFAALSSAMTPGGMTESFCRTIFSRGLLPHRSETP